MRQNVTQRLSSPALFARYTGHARGTNQIRPLGEHDLARQFAAVHVALAVTSHLRILRCCDAPIQCLARGVVRHMRPTPERHGLKTVPGMGDMLAWTIRLETGPMARFPGAGALASDGRGVKSPRRSHGQVQGQGNTKDGTTDLGWAVVEAAPVAMRCAPGSTRFSQRQPVTRHQLVALKTVTHT